MRVGTRTGIAATFRLPRPVVKGTIYQKVSIVYEGGGSTDTYRYTEAWSVDPRGKPVVDQGGVDAFLVSLVDVRRFRGVVRFKTVAWFQPGIRDKSMRKGHDLEGWGTLWGKDGHLAVPQGAQTVKRIVTARWSKGGRVQWKT